METTIYIMKFFIFWLALAGTALLGVWLTDLYQAWKAKQRALELQYDLKYLWLSNLIGTSEVTMKNYKKILHQLAELGQLEWKNREKTTVLTMRFLNLFADMAAEDATQDEFSPSEVLRSN
jgi:hypothetical protein